MRTKFYSARDAAKNFGAVMEAAENAPVMIRRHGRPRAVVIGWRLFEEYKKAYDDAFDERVLHLLELQLEAAIEGKLGTADRIHALTKRLMEGEAGLSDKTPTEKREDAQR